jgi:hypothetical protein
MRTATTISLAALFTLLVGSAGGQDEQAKKVVEQKKSAEAAWQSLEIGPFATFETKHLLLYSPKSSEKRLKAISSTLEKYHAQAMKVTGLDPKDGYPGKITVYLLSDRQTLTTFARRIEKRRPMESETGSFQSADDALHAVAIMTDSKTPVEAKAGEMIAALLAQRRAGVRTQVPDWLLTGFGRATSYQVSPREKFVLEDRKAARLYIKKREASQVWDGTLEAEEADCLQGSLAELLSYGSPKRFAKILEGFKPEENVPTKTTPAALEAAGLSAEKVAKTWKAWVR